MASKHTKIPRSINEFKLFLDYNEVAYHDASKHIKEGQGWNIPFYRDELFLIVVNLEGNLYEGIYPKLMDHNPTSDEEITNSFKGALSLFKRDTWVFEAIIQKKKEKGEEAFLSTVEGIVEALLSKAIYKLKEVIQLAEEDVIKGKVNEQILAVEEQTKAKDYLIGFVTATNAEFQAVKNRLQGVTLLPTSESDSQIYYDGTIVGNDKRIKVILTQCHHQGTAAASTTTTKLTLRFNPNLVVMLGHAAGNKNLVGSLNLGDILICSEAVDYDQVTIIETPTTGSAPNIKEKDRKIIVTADPTLLGLIENFASDQAVLDSIKETSSVKSLIPHPLYYRIGKLISGDALVRSEAWFQKIISDNTGAIGLDMETYGVYYSAEHTVFKRKPLYISIKSVSDFGSHRTNLPAELEEPTNRVAYAIHTSVEFFFRFAVEHLPI